MTTSVARRLRLGHPADGCRARAADRAERRQEARAPARFRRTGGRSTKAEPLASTQKIGVRFPLPAPIFLFSRRRLSDQDAGPSNRKVGVRIPSAGPFPLRLTAGRCTLNAEIVVRIHEGEPPRRYPECVPGRGGCPPAKCPRSAASRACPDLPTMMRNPGKPGLRGGKRHCCRYASPAAGVCL
jgi:hypothetical protein